MKRTSPIAAVLLTAVLASACGGADAPAATAQVDAPAAVKTELAAAPAAGNVVEVTMGSNPGVGEVFGRADVAVKRGDVVRFGPPARRTT